MSSFFSARFREGAREAVGVPIAVLCAGYIGFGTLAADAGYSLTVTFFSTFVIWALPGQLVLNELYAVGAPLVAVVGAVSFTAIRLLPMTMTLMPWVRSPEHPTWRYYAAAHLVAMTTWAITMRRAPDLPPAERLKFFVGFSAVCGSSCATAGAVGYLLGHLVPHTVTLGLVFVTPLYFCVILIGDARRRVMMLALACGAIAGPFIYRIDPQWSVLATGLIGGSIAYFLNRLMGGRRA